MKTEKHYDGIVLLQIALLLGMTFSNIYFLSESFETGLGNSPGVLSNIIDFFNLLPSVSALDASDLNAGVATCVKTKSGASCQEFAASECSAQCDGACIPSSRNNVQQCKPGTCYSPSQGSCQIGAPKITCEQSGGQWFDNPTGNIPQCRKGCCILGGQSAFVTSQECNAMSSRLGAQRTFRSEITTELACLALSGGDKEGACVIERNGENTCRFGTKTQCNGLRGEFHEGYLCSAPQLQTTCIRQTTALCVDTKEELYWFDSCGNRENIYSANKDQSWNNGRILSKDRSCSLTSSNGQATCGNCNYLLGTKCGPKTQTQKVADNTIQFVCRNLECVDAEGKTRKNGESWCSYQSSIGVDSGRSTDAAGSRHFRQLCINGEVKIEPCQDFRNGICVESTDTGVPGGFSSAACRINSWQQCINYNVNNETARCTQNNDCFLNEVRISNSYDYKVCVPKYNPGFDLTTRAQGAELTCSIANQKCTVLYVKKLRGLKVEWVCEKNCECETAAFTEKLNNLCMSLGDCGAKVNVAGKVTENYRISNAPKLNSNYINNLARYANVVPGKVASPGNMTQIVESGALGLPSIINGEFEDPNEAAIQFALNTGGAIGVTAIILAKTIPALAGISKITVFVAGAGKVLGGVGSATIATGGAGVAATSSSGASIAIGSSGPAAALSPGSLNLAGFGGAFVGAAVGLAVVSILLKATGVGRGISPGVAYSLMAAGAAGGAMVGYSLVASTATTAGWVPVVGWILVGAAVIVTGVLKLLGVGDTKQVVVEFQCQPWQAPTGGADCNKCGKNGMPCSKYACQSLGQTCQLINEGTERQMCTDVSPQDVAAPIISPWNDALLPGYTNTAVTSEGFTVKPVSQDCVQAYTMMQVGITLNEPAQCKFDNEHTSAYRDMEFSFGNRNLYLQNHSMNLSIPSLESLGVYNISASSRADYNLFVRCQDRNGNANVREYNINFCVSQGNDIVPPIMVRGAPASDDVAMNVTQENIVVLTNEPATCRINTFDTIYANMPTNMTCYNNATDQSAFGFACNALVALPGNVSNFYVRCADQPWLNATHYAEGKQNNVNGQSLAITLRKTTRPLRIESLEPNNVTINSAMYPATVEITARTSGGVDNGRAVCSINISSTWHQFLETDSIQHKQVFNQLSDGNKTVQIQCVDRVGNGAQRSSQFRVVIDNIIPTITRVYADQNSLFVITDENSECRYSNRQCQFEYEDGLPMSGIEKVHTNSLDNNKDYFIMCKDRLGNKPGQCQITVREGRIV